MFKKMSFLLFLFCVNSTALADAALDSSLNQRCLDTFNFIEAQDLAAYMAQMPPAYTKGHEKRLAKILARSHKRWFTEGDKTKSIELTGIDYGKASQGKKERFGAVAMAEVNISIVSEKSTSPRVSCKFMKTADGWFLSKIP